MLINKRSSGLLCILGSMGVLRAMVDAPGVLRAMLESADGAIENDEISMLLSSIMGACGVFGVNRGRAVVILETADDARPLDGDATLDLLSTISLTASSNSAAHSFMFFRKINNQSRF